MAPLGPTSRSCRSAERKSVSLLQVLRAEPIGPLSGCGCELVGKRERVQPAKALGFWSKLGLRTSRQAVDLVGQRFEVGYPGGDCGAVG